MNESIKAMNREKEKREGKKKKKRRRRRKTSKGIKSDKNKTDQKMKAE